MIETGNLTEDLCQFARIYMKKVTPEFVKLSLGLRTPELAEDTREGILAIPQVFKTGVTAYFRKMYEKGKLISDDYESMAMMFLSLHLSMGWPSKYINIWYHAVPFIFNSYASVHLRRKEKI